MTRSRLHFWFDFASTYSYLSAMRIQAAASVAGIDVVWRPFLLGPIFRDCGWNDSPFNIYPAKGRYMWRDIERRSAAAGLPFQRPLVFPQNSLKAARIATALNRSPQLPDFCKNVFQAAFGSGRDISQGDVLISCLTASGASPDFLAKAEESEVKLALRHQVERARELDLFGAPSFTIGSEVFWGDDRLEDALGFAACQNRGGQI